MQPHGAGPEAASLRDARIAAERAEEAEVKYLIELVGEHGWRWVKMQSPDRKAEVIRELETIAQARREVFFDQHRHHAAIFETPERQREIEREIRQRIADRASPWYHIKPLLWLLVGFLVFLASVRIFGSEVVIVGILGTVLAVYVIGLLVEVYHSAK